MISPLYCICKIRYQYSGQYPYGYMSTCPWVQVLTGTSKERVPEIEEEYRVQVLQSRPCILTSMTPDSQAISVQWDADLIYYSLQLVVILRIFIKHSLVIAHRRCINPRWNARQMQIHRCGCCCWMSGRISEMVPVCSWRRINPLRSGQNGRHFADGIFKCSVLNENMKYDFIEICSLWYYWE